MFMVLGLKYGYASPEDNQAKKELYKKVQEVAGLFKDDNGSIICRELLGLNQTGKSDPTPELRTESYYKKRPCKDLVQFAADLVDEYIKNH